MAIFVIFWLILAKISLPWQRPLEPCNQKCLLWIGRPRKPPVIGNHILVISHENGFICIYSNFSPKICCHGNAPLSHVYGSVIDEFPIAQTLFQNQTLHWYVAYNWSYGHFSDFWPILAKIWLPWQRPLDPCNQKYFLWIGRSGKLPVISNCILVISRRNAFVCIYSNFCPKIGCHGNAPLSHVYGSVIDEFPHSTNPIPKPNSALICCIQLRLWPFCDFFGLFWPKFRCHGNVP